MNQNTKNKFELLNFVLIGCGRIAQTHLQAIAEIPECELKAVVDINKNTAQATADQHSCKAYTDYCKVLDDYPIDAAVIAAPPNTHAEIAIFFLSRGSHVLCEKPIAISSEQAEMMVQSAEDNNLHLMMASKFRYVDDVIWAKSQVASGMLGDIVLYENVFCSRVDMDNRWNSEKKIAGGGVLIDNGCHSVDIARFLLGPISKVQAEEGRRVQNTEVEDTAHLFFKTQSGVQGNIDLSWSIHKELESYVDIFGTKGVLSIGWQSSKYRQNEKLDWVKFGLGYDKLKAFKRQLENFVGAIKGREAPLINAVDALESVRVIEAAYQSMSKDKWVEVNSSPMWNGSSSNEDKLNFIKDPVIHSN